MTAPAKPSALAISGARPDTAGPDVFGPGMPQQIVIADDRAQRAVEAILEKAKTGKIGDGKIFLTEVEEAVRIRTGERGGEAL